MGGGLARLGLEMAGHECTGVELDPIKHHLSTFVGSGNCVWGDALKFDVSGFDAVWASPPCQQYSAARTQGEVASKFGGDFLDFCLAIETPILWVENVINPYAEHFGTLWNAAQFTKEPLQCRNRIIGGRYNHPWPYRKYSKVYPGVCPAITATEHKGCASDVRRASRFYGRRLTIQECAYHQGFNIPEAWLRKPFGFNGSVTKWGYQLYEAIGNGVPVYMAKAFGEVYK